MRILVDIGHPAHVHYFRNFIKIMESRGHEIVVSARNRDIIFYLLDHYNINYFNRGKGRNAFFGKLIYMLIADFKILRKTWTLKPDIFISFSTPYATQVSFLLGKPSISINDTEHTDKSHKIFTYPFSNSILTPFCYYNDLGKKHIKINSVIESLYLNSKYFKPQPDIFELLKLKKKEKYIIMRFVSWKAFHDHDHSGIDNQTKRKLISIISKDYRVFISSEDILPSEFNSYKLQISPERMHDVLKYAYLFIGESGTMASECAILGTPAVYVNSLPLMSYLELEQNAGTLKHFNCSEGVIEYVTSKLKDDDLKIKADINKDKMIAEFISPTDFLVWFIETYPKSVKIMKENPDYQNKFK